MSDLEKDLKEFYKQTDYDIQPDMKELESLKLRFENNKKLKVQQNIFWKKFVISACCLLVILIPAIILPIILNNRNSEPPTYYTKDTIKDENYSLEELSNFVDSNYNQFNFLFSNNYIIDNIISYAIEDGTLMSFEFNVIIGTTTNKINFVTYKNFVFDQHTIYTDYAEITTTSQYTKYYSETGFSSSKKTYILYDYNSYRIYIETTELNSEFINKFENF